MFCVMLYLCTPPFVVIHFYTVCRCALNFNLYFVFGCFKRLCFHSTFDPVAVGVVLAALVHRVFVEDQPHVVVSTLDRGEAGRVSHLSPLQPAGHTQMHPQLSGPEKNHSRISTCSQVPACTAVVGTGEIH